MSDKIDQLYDALKADGAVQNSRENFRKFFLTQGDEGYYNRKSLYDALKADGAVQSPTYEDFMQNFGWKGVKRPVQQTATPPSYNFAPLDTRQAEQAGIGRGPVPFNQQQPTQNPVSRLLYGDQTPEEQKKLQKHLGQRMDELEYEQETGNRMRQPVKDIQFEAPTIARDAYGNVRRDESGNPLIGFSTDENVVNTHRQILADQAEWDALPESEKRERARESKLRAEMMDYKEPTLWDTVKRSLGSGIIRKGAEFLDLMQQLTSGMIVEDPSKPSGYMRTRSYDEALKDKNDPITRATDYLHETSERLSRQAQPHYGKGFLDMLWDGEIGNFLQKGIGTAFESLPNTLSIVNPLAMVANGMMMAGGNYREQVLENPDIPEWKRFSMAVGMAAIEQLTEKYSDPFFKYVRGSRLFKSLGKEASEEAMKNITKEATENIAKRIFQRLAHIGKDAVGEGAEEIISNFGSDTLGEMLDLIDGKKNYGLRAQWAERKKNNPDADLWEFAMEKAKEYSEAGIGGFMAGAYMSGSAQVSIKGLEYALGGKANADHIASNPNTRIDPATMEVAQSYDDGYTDEDPNDQKQFSDEAQAAEQNLPQYGEKFAKMVTESQSPVETLDYLMQNRDYFTDEQIAAAFDYYKKRSRIEGAMDGTLDRIDMQVEQANEKVRDNMHQGTGQVVTAQIGDGAYYVIGGDIVTDETTGIPVVTGTGGAVVVKDALTGDVSVKSPQQITVTSMTPADDMIRYNEEILRKQLMDQANADYAYGSPANEVYQLEDIVTLQDRDGNIIEGEIGMMPNSVDGVYVVYTPDKKALQYTADQLNRMIVIHNGQEVQRGAQLSQSPTDQVVVSQQPENTQTGENYAQNQPENIQSSDLDNAGAQASAEKVATSDENVATSPVSALDRIPILTDEKGQPVLKKGKKQYQWHKASTEDAAAALIETTGGNMVMARDNANRLVKTAKDKLEKIRKQEPKGEDPLELAESSMAIQKQIDDTQATIKQWQDVASSIQKQMNVESERLRQEAEAKKSEEQRQREAAEAAERKKQQEEIDRQRIREQIEKDKERRNKEYQPLIDAREEMADDPDATAILSDTEPRSLDEWVSSLLRPHSMLWQDASQSEIGLQSELGLKRGDMQRMLTLLGTKESGAKPFGQVVLDIHEGLTDAMKDQYTDEDVRQTLLDLFSEGSSTRMLHLTEEHRIEEAREAYQENLRRAAEYELEQWAESNHLTPAERETYEDFLSEDYFKTNAALNNEQEFIDKIIADEEQNRRGQEVDLDNTSGTAGRESEGGESQVQRQGAAEETGADQTQQQDQGNETPAGSQTVPDTDVSGGTPKRVTFPVREQNVPSVGTNNSQGGNNQPATIKPSEQLKPIDLRDATRVESPEIGVAEANAKARYQLSATEKDAEGNSFYEKDGSIDLWTLTELFTKAGRQAAPIRLTDRNLQHIIDQHKKEIGGENNVFDFLDDIFKNAKVLRRAKGRGMFVIVENDKTDKAAIIKLMPSDTGDYYNVETAGYYRKNKWKENEDVIADLSEPDQSDAVADVSKPQIPDKNGREPINAETQASSSEDKDTNNSANLQEKTEKSSEKSAKEPKRLVSDEKMEELRKRLLDKLNNLNAGVDPEMMLLGAMYAVGNIERGVTKFADYAKKMVTDLGDKIRPYLKSFYNAVRDMPEAQEYASQMDDYATVSGFDVYNFDKQQTPDAITKAEQVVTEQRIRNKAKKIQDQPDLFAGDLFGAQAKTEPKPKSAPRTKAETQQKKRKPQISDFDSLQTGKRFVTPDGTIEIARVDYDTLQVWDIDADGNRSNRTRAVDTVDVVDGLKTGIVTEVGSQSAIGATSTPSQVAAEEAKVDTNPTEAQKEAGNYQKGHIKVDGYDITIENPKGSVRSGVDQNGKAWSQVMNNTYGYIRGTEGVDGDHIDVFLSDNPTSGQVFVVDQVNPETGEFDEHKVLLGYADAAEATQAYLSNYEPGWKGLGAISGVSHEAFKEWINSSHRKTKPFREYALAKREQAKQQQNILNQLGDLQDNGRQYEENKPEAYELGKQFAGTLPKGTTSKEALRLASKALDANKAKGGVYALPFFDGVTDAIRVEPSEQLKPTDLRDGIKPDTAEIGSAEAKAKARHLQSVKDGVAKHLEKYRTLAPVEIIDIDTNEEYQSLKDSKDPVAFDPETKKILIFANNIDEDYFEEGLFHESVHRGLQQYYGDGPIELAEAFWETVSPDKPDVSKRQKEAISKEYAHKPEDIKEEYFVHLLSHHMKKGSVDRILSRLSPEHQEIVNNILHNIGYDTAEETKRRTGEETKASGSPENSEKSGDGRRVTPSSTDKIEDVGEEIAGARKDLSRKIAQSLNSATKQTLAELPFSKAYKKPDLKKAVEEGALRESDAVFYDAFFSSFVDQNKPRVTKAEERRKKYNPGYKTDLEKWVDRTHQSLQTLKDFVEADEQQRDRIIEALLADKYPFREQELSDIEKRKEWNKDRKDLEWGDKTTPNPLWITYEVMKRLDYTPGDKLDIPFGILKADSTGTQYSLYNKKNDRNYYTSPKTVEEGIDAIVWLARLKRGDSDIQFPVSSFYTSPTKSETGENGMFRVIWGSFRNPQTRDFDSKEKAEEFAKTKKAATHIMPLRDVVRRFGYKVMFRNPLTGERYAVNDKEFDTDAEAMQYLDENYDEINSELNDILSAKQTEKENAGKKELTADDMVYTAMIRNKDGKYTYGVLIDKKYANNYGMPLVIKDGFATRNEAKEFADNAKEEVFKAYQEYKAKQKAFVYFDTGADSRIGEDYRSGKDVTAEDFMNTFGFRGVQFGNWTNQADRQMAVNQAYDAFLDLAKLIGVSPKAISLNGELGIAFGARGSGNFAAHYEPGEIVINLTKTMGAGSLAHEWWHALDNYFARTAGERGGMVTDDRSLSMRQQLRDAFNTMLNQVAKSPYYSRSKDKGDYWGRMHEVTARLLAEWVDQELKKRGELNTFLSRGAKTEGTMKINYERYKKHAELAGKEVMPFEEYKKLDEAMAGSPYPSPREVERFSDAMRNVFDIMQERIDEETGNVALYQKVSGTETAAPDSRETALRDALIDTMRDAGILVGTDTEVGQNVLDDVEGNAKTSKEKYFRTKDGRAYGYTYNGKIYIDPSIATSETPIHEYTHLWAEALRQKDPEKWDSIVEVLKNDKNVKPFWDKVSKQYPELTDDNDIAEEVLAQYSGKRGSEQLREVADEIQRETPGIFGKAQAVEALRRMKNVLAKFWKSVADMMEWKFTKAEEIADSVLSDLLSGVNPGEQAIKDYVLSEFNRAKEGNAPGERIPLGNLTEEGKNYLESISGMIMKPEVSFILNASELRHIYNDHYGDNEKDKGNNIPLTDDDIRSIVDVLTSPDKIVFAVENKTGRKLFFFMKDAGNGTYNLAEVYANSKGNLTTKSFYKTKKSIAQRANELLKDPKLSTSETGGESSFSGANIPKLFETSKDLPQKVNKNSIRPQKVDDVVQQADNERPHYQKGENAMDYAERLAEYDRQKKMGSPEEEPVNMARQIYEDAIRDTGDRMMIPAMLASIFNKETKERFKHKFAESWWDYSRSIKALQDAIEKTTGKTIQGFEEVWRTLNAKSSIDNDQIQKVMHDLIEPLSEYVGNMVKGKEIDGHRMTLDDVEKYMNAVHGIERNIGMAMKQAKDEYEEDTALLRQQLESGELSGNERKSVEDALLIKEARYNGIKDYMGNEVVSKWYNQWKRGLENAKRNGTITEDEYIKAKEKMEAEYEQGWKFKYRSKDYSGLTALFADEFKDEKDKPTEDLLEQAAKDYASNFEKIVGKESAEGLWQRVKALNEWSLRKSYESGLISKDQYNDTLSMYKHYVPLRGWHDDYAGDVYQYISRGEPAEVLQGVLKKAYGRKSRAARIFGTMAAMANTAIIQGNKNLVAQHLLNMAMNHKDAGLLMPSEQYYQKNADGQMIPQMPALNDDMTPDEMRQELERFEADMKAREDAGDVQTLRRKFKKEFPLHMAKWQEQRHAVRVMRNGKEYMVYILGNPRAAEAFNGLLNPNSQPGAISNIVNMWNRWLAKWQTSLSPEFLFSNFQRDVMTATTGAYIKFGNDYKRQFEKNILSVMPLTKATLKKLKGEEAKNLGGIFSLFRKYDSGTLDMNDETERLFKEFIEGGGMTGISHITKAEEYQESMEKMVRRMRQGKMGKVRKGWEAVGDGIEFLNKGIENATRFATYMTSRQQGRSIRDSIFDAKEASVNFNMKGSGAWGNMMARRLYLYVNPAMQALRMLGTWYENDPVVATKEGGKMVAKAVGKRFLKTAAGVLTASVTCAIVNKLLSELLHGGDGDDDDKNKGDCWALSEWNRYNYINVINPFGKGYFHWSIPQELRPLWAMGQIAVDMAFGRKTWQRGLQSMVLQLNNLSPLSFFEGGTDGGETVIESELRTMTPSFLAPFFDAYFWNRDFMGHKITNRTGFNKEDPEWKRAGDDTPRAIINTSRKLNNITGGADNSRGWLEDNILGGTTNPSAMYYLATQQFGGVGSMAKRLFNLIDQAADDEKEVELRNIPFVPKVYVSTGDDHSKQRVLNDKFWMYYGEYKGADHEIKKNKKDVEAKEMTQEYADKRIEERKADGTYNTWKIFEDNDFDYIFDKLRGTKQEDDVKRMVVDAIENGKMPDYEAMLSDPNRNADNDGLFYKVRMRQIEHKVDDMKSEDAFAEFDKTEDPRMRKELAKRISKDAGASEDPYGDKPRSDHAYQYQLQRTAEDVREDAMLYALQEKMRDDDNEREKDDLAKERKRVHSSSTLLHGGRSDDKIMEDIRKNRKRLMEKYGLLERKR